MLLVLKYICTVSVTNLIACAYTWYTKSIYNHVCFCIFYRIFNRTIHFIEKDILAAIEN